ncbi:hypothetical protein LPE509_00432 [Legionella pneumophila subsp. pneumophila LPE509]|nr:hypothetical protein LPE509_00432 [Legionella pneumophila subsp. pneumophila LPE509]
MKGDFQSPLRKWMIKFNNSVDDENTLTMNYPQKLGTLV